VCVCVCVCVCVFVCVCVRERERVNVCLIVFIKWSQVLLEDVLHLCLYWFIFPNNCTSTVLASTLHRTDCCERAWCKHIYTSRGWLNLGLRMQRGAWSHLTHEFSVLWCVAVWCGVMQCVAVCCSVLRCVAVCCSVVQRVAVWCNVLQWYV